MSKSAFEGDDKIKTANGRDPFAFVQLFCYVASSASMLLYFMHFVASYPLSTRIKGSATTEVIYLFIRWANEIAYKRWELGDLMHHFSFLIGLYAVFYVESCIPFAWLVCHLQILHFPLSFWYFGCKRGCYSTSPSSQLFCKKVFPQFWFFSVFYRLSLVIFTVYFAFVAKNFMTVFVITVIGSLLSYLDWGWTKYFMGTLGWPRNSLFLIISSLFGFIVGLATHLL
jgi:hypothetical protein